MPENHDSETWRETIDTDIKDLSGRMAGVEAGLEGFGRSFDHFRADFSEYMNRQREDLKPKWSVLIAGFTLIFVVISTIFGAILSGYVRDQNRIETVVTGIASNRISAQDPTQDQAINTLTAEMHKVRETVRAFQLETAAKDAIMLERSHWLQRHVITDNRIKHEGSHGD